MTAASVRYVAIGDSFTEGVGDELPDGTVRGWADLVATGWAASRGAPVEYANLAVRGKLVWPIVREQLEAALALRPTHLSFNGGGNDMLRPRTTVPHIAAAFSHVLRRCDEEGVRLILLSGANPSAQLPLGGLVQRRGDALSEAVAARIVGRDDVVRAFNWPDTELSRPDHWSQDRLHMNARGHHRVAARVLEALGERAPDGWWSLPDVPESARLSGRDYAREHLGPWVRRRLTGTSSGDGRPPKLPDWVRVAG
ncbi:SGNH/GDSL hydrolase family protein [Microbacterium sp. No. 7]|uniref:SGNH/GDSL hydrolase family protein n=1 Tax=Microbacterium sp. No. 7 TaxID=1714373 RepID=UPI0006CFBD21|nr:SGNH/GDSL hydrolase family protein [Microbacterium sp. No. 7]ALJ20211.1 GDSL family lipase [Microbacterium sp. No. 7]